MSSLSFLVRYFDNFNSRAKGVIEFTLSELFRLHSLWHLLFLMPIDTVFPYRWLCIITP